MNQNVSTQEGKSRHVSANTLTPARAGGQQPSRLSSNSRPIPTKPKTGFLYKLVLRFLIRWGMRKHFEAGISKTGHFTFTAHYSSTSGLNVASPEKILYTPNNVYGVEGIVYSVRLGSLISETVGDVSTIWKVIELQEPSILYCKRMKKI
jgi:hypothetical protein